MVLAIEGFAIEVTPCRGIHLLVGYIAFVFVKSLLCFPLSFSNINPGWALIADNFIDYIYCFTIDWCSYVPAFSRMKGFMSVLNRNDIFDLLPKPSLLFIKLPNTLPKTRLLPKTKPSAEGLIFCRRCSFLPKFQFSSCPCCSQKICCPSQILSNEFRLDWPFMIPTSQQVYKQ